MRWERVEVVFRGWYLSWWVWQLVMCVLSAVDWCEQRLNVPSRRIVFEDVQGMQGRECTRVVVVQRAGMPTDCAVFFSFLLRRLQPCSGIYILRFISPMLADGRDVGFNTACCLMKQGV